MDNIFMYKYKVTKMSTSYFTFVDVSLCNLMHFNAFGCLLQPGLLVDLTSADN